MMKPDKYKELEVASYNECDLCFIRHTAVPAGEKCFKFHGLDRIEIFRVTKGEISVTVENEQFVAKENSILAFYPRQLRAGVAGENGAEYDGVIFDLENFKMPAVKKYFESVSHGKINLQNISKNKRTVKAYDLLYSFSGRGDSAKDAFETVSLIYFLFSNLCDRDQKQFETNQRTKKAVTSILEYVEEHLSEPLTTEEICAKFGYSKSYFCRLFKAHTGVSFLNYCVIARLERAKALLKETDITANEVAIKCGFRNYSYFSRTFKKHYFISPSEYIERMRK